MNRSSLVPTDCPFDFPDVDGNGGSLLRVMGPPVFARWTAEYSVPQSSPLCPFCSKLVTTYKGHGDPQARCVAVIDEQYFWVHVGCMVEKLGRRTIVQGHKPRPEKAA